MPSSYSSSLPWSHWGCPFPGVPQRSKGSNIKWVLSEVPLVFSRDSLVSAPHKPFKSTTCVACGPFLGTRMLLQSWEAQDWDWASLGYHAPFLSPSTIQSMSSGLFKEREAVFIHWVYLLASLSSWNRWRKKYLEQNTSNSVYFFYSFMTIKIKQKLIS